MSKRAIIFDLDHTLFATEQTLHEGVADLLGILRRLGFKLGALSGNDHRTIVRLEEAGIRDYFEAVLCSDHLTMPKAARGIERMLSGLGVEAQHAQLVSHAHGDILLAQEAGLAKAIGVSHGMDNTVPLKRAGANHVVEDIPSVLDVVE
jgi:phosphoglycolate phosphatase-like HAD superfamily hydrolase